MKTWNKVLFFTCNMSRKRSFPSPWVSSKHQMERCLIVDFAVQAFPPVILQLGVCKPHKLLFQV